MQAFGSQEAEVLVDAQGWDVVDFGFEGDLTRMSVGDQIGLDGRAYLICIFCNHLLNCSLNQSSGNALAAILLTCGEHSDVAAHGATTVRFQLAYDDSDQVVLVIEGLPLLIRRKDSGVRLEARHTIKQRWPH